MQDGAYNTQNQYGKPTGVRSYVSKHIRSFSMSQSNSRYLDGVTKGHRSAVVNRAMDYYRQAPDLVTEEEYKKNIAALQSRLTALHQKIDQIPGAGEITDNEAKNVPQGWGKRLIFHLKRSFRI